MLSQSSRYVHVAYENHSKKLTSDQTPQEQMQLRGGKGGGICCGMYAIPISPVVSACQTNIQQLRRYLRVRVL